ncbi:hypothetical protein LTR53_001792 [Teratosphaeriaceae sp. CCFEE 6253]|nr:hypothetical protein LTR53_001792 [Teratosphaeriaceae sp. CCFEE 6253]
MRTLTQLLALCALGAAAQTPTLTRGFGDVPNSTLFATVLAGHITDGLVASIVAADPCAVTYVFTCGGDDAACDGRGWPYTLTKGLSTYEMRYTTSASGTRAAAWELCSMHGSYSAVCVETVSYSFSGTRSATTVATSAAGAEVTYGQFPITAGASKLAKATGVCTASGNAAVPTGGVEVWKVLVAPAAAVAVVAGMYA